jgi:hypothetical protein
VSPLLASTEDASRLGGCRRRRGVLEEGVGERPTHAPYTLLVEREPDQDRAHWRLWPDRVWAARQSLANVEHRLENPPRPASEQPEDSTDVEAARAQLTQLEAVLQESLVALAAIADEMAFYRETDLAE